MTDTPEQQIAKLPFRNTAGKAFKSAADEGDLKAFQKSFTKHLAKAAKTFGKSVEDFAAQRSASWNWSQPSDVDLAVLLRDNGDQQTAMETQLTNQSAEATTYDTSSPSGIGPFEALVISEFLLRHTSSITPSLLACLVARLAQFRIPTVEYKTDETPRASLIEQLAVYGEAPFVVSIVLSFLKPSRVLGQTGRKNLAAILADSTDKDGTLHGELSAGCYEFFASYVRVSIWSAAFNESWAKDRTNSLWHLTLAQGATACDDAGFVLDTAAGFRQISAMAMLVQGGEFAAAGKANPLNAMLKDISSPAKPRKADKKKKVKTGSSAGSSQSDWAANAVLRSGLTSNADSIGLSWSGEDVHVGLSCEGRRLLTGKWNYNIKVDGEPNVSMGEWVCTCWFTDDDVAFVELEKGSADGIRHVRHVMLSTAENMALLVDTVTAATEESVVEFDADLTNVSGHFPTLERNPITRELRGDSSMPELRVVPVWLEEDRLMNASGNCAADADGIHITANGTGGVTVPLVIDWNRRRKAAEADWNRLTVTEDRKVLSQHHTGAYRVRIGLNQLLIFRSLRPGTQLRAALGYNTSHETAYGSICHSGVIDPLVMVEAEA